MLPEWPLWAQLTLAYVVTARLVELVHARRNTRRLLAEGGEEHYPGHYPLFFAVHGGWIVALALFARPAEVPSPWLAALFALSQIVRLWVFVTLGRWWTTRIISAPHFPRISHGPYRFIRHPNYAVVVTEIALLPLLLGAPWVALIFSLANAALLSWRIRLENRVLARREGGRQSS